MGGTEVGGTGTAGTGLHLREKEGGDDRTESRLGYEWVGLR